MFTGVAMEIFGQSYVPGINNNVASLRGGQRLLQASAPGETEIVKGKERDVDPDLITDGRAYSHSADATDYQSVSFALIIGIFAMGGCAFAMMVTLAVKMRYHALSLKALKLEMTKNNVEHAKYKIKRDAEIQGKWDTMVGAPSGTTTFVAGPDIYRPDYRGPVFEGC